MCFKKINKKIEKNHKYIKVFLVILLKICSIMYYDEKVMFSNNYPYG